MLTSLEIENFKGIAARQRIDFAPLTLLFGPNSAGKSTVLQALIYLHELLDGNADVDRTELGGAVLELGGFARLVHKHDLNRRIVLRVEFDTPGRLEKFDRDLEGFLVNLDDEIKSAWVEVTIRYAMTPVFRGPLAECVEIGVGRDRRALVRLETRGLREREPLRVQVNFDHPLMSSVEEAVVEAWKNIAEMPSKSADLDEAASEEAEAPQSGSRGATSDSVDWLRQPTYAVSLSRQSALPPIGEPLAVIDLGDTDVVRENLVTVDRRLEEGLLDHIRDDAKKVSHLLLDEILRREQTLVEVRTFLEMVIVGTISQLARSLRDAIYIGPLRTVPPRGFLYQRAGRISSWVDGLAAWDLLLADRLGLVDDTNDWLRRLEANCQVRVQQLYDSSASAEELSAGHVDKTARRLMLDVGGDTLVLPSEVGAGVSQVMPVVVAALERRPGLTLVEQPEIHVHPAMQVVLGDLFIRAVTQDGSRRTILLETHSEHIILRILRRIRETSEEELSEDAPAFSKDKLSVLYVESTSDGMVVHRLRVDEKGEFLDRWPKGFFAERMRELL